MSKKVKMSNQQDRYMKNIVNRSHDMNGGLALTRRQVESIIKFDSNAINALKGFCYDPYFPYRKYIEQQPDNIKILCYVYWYLEGYYFRNGEYGSGFEYTNKLCKRLKLDAIKVIERINAEIFNYL